MSASSSMPSSGDSPVRFAPPAASMTTRLARVTTGDVWLGTRAVELGLIDGLAEDADTALEAAQDLAALPHHLTVRLGGRRSLLQRLGVPGAGMGPPGERWLVEMESWLGAPRLRA